MSRPSISFFGKKSLVLVFALVLAATSAVNALANRTRFTQPEEALRWRPDDAVALSMVEDKRWTANVVDAASAAAVADTARRALRSDPLTPSALRQIGVVEALAGRSAEAATLMALSHRISRRELGTAIWLIDDSLSKGDVGSMLRYCDEALTTNVAAKDMLLPALVSGLFDPGLRSGLASHLRAGRPWTAALLRRAAIADGDEVVDASKLVIAAGGVPKTKAFDGLDSQILSALAVKAQFGAARAYLRILGRGGRDVSTAAGFTARTIDPALGPFGWYLVNQPNYGAVADAGGGLVLVRVAPDQRATVATRILMLSPGRYRLSQLVSGSAGVALARTSWQISCLASAPVARTWPLALRSVSAYGREQADFEIPAECAAQRLQLIVDGDDIEGDGEAAVRSLALERI